jgi:hypothetical protein
METLEPRQISVLEPIGAAFEKTTDILFHPFDLQKWFVLGFCAWLSTFGDRGGGGGGGRFNVGGSHQPVRQELDQLKDGILEHLPVVISVAAVVFVLVVAIALVVMWLRSRGQFMFLHGVARNVGEVVEPWKRYAKQANSLFLFYIVLGLIGLMVTLLLVVPLIITIATLAESDFQLLTPPAVFLSVGLVLGLIGFIIAMTVVRVLTKDFVVPIMYLQGCSVTEGWKRFWPLCRSHLGTFALFILTLIVINMAITMLVVLLILMTCCVAACILIIPYLGTVALLPIFVWRRAYSALLLAQFGPEYDVFAAPGQPAVVDGEVVEQNF